MRKRNVIGPQIRRLRSRKGWSQNDLTIKLQIFGMEHATRAKVAKIEARKVCVADDDLIYIARALGVSTEALYPDLIRCAKRLYEAICMVNASHYGIVIFCLLSCSQTGAGVREFAVSLASV